MTSAHPQPRFADLLRSGRRPLRELLGPDAHYAYGLKARACLEHLLRALPNTGRGVVMVPAYHCPTLVQSVLRAGMKVRFFAIRDDLSVDLEHLEAQLDSNVAALIVIHYFGFEARTRDVAARCAARETVLIEDWSHSFLRAAPLRLAGEVGDYALYSPWKLVPCGNGGLLRRIGAGRLPSLGLKPPPLALTARLYKSMFESACAGLEDDALLKRAYFALEARRTASASGHPEAGEHEAELPPATLATFYPEDPALFNARLPWLCRRVLEHAELADMVHRRRANYRDFAALVPRRPDLQPCYPVLDDDTCPWAYPLRMTGRRGRDQQLRDRGVAFFTFGEFLHPLLDAAALPAAVKDSATRLSTEMICFPVHQQVDSKDFASVCAALEAVIESPAPARVAES